MKLVYSLLFTAVIAVPSMAQFPGRGPGGNGGFGPPQGSPPAQEIERLRDQVRALEEKLKQAQAPKGEPRKEEPRKPEVRKDEPKKPEVRKEEPRKPEVRKDEPKKPEVKSPQPEIKRDVEVRVFDKKVEGPKGGEGPKGDVLMFKTQGGPGSGQPHVMWLQSAGGPPGMNKLTPEEQMILKTLLTKAGMGQGQGMGGAARMDVRPLNPQPIPPKQAEQPRPPQSREPMRGRTNDRDGGGEQRGPMTRPVEGARMTVEQRIERLERMVEELVRSQKR